MSTKLFIIHTLCAAVLLSGCQKDDTGLPDADTAQEKFQIRLVIDDFEDVEITTRSTPTNMERLIEEQTMRILIFDGKTGFYKEEHHDREFVIEGANGDKVRMLVLPYILPEIGDKVVIIVNCNYVGSSFLTPGVSTVDDINDYLLTRHEGGFPMNINLPQYKRAMCGEFIRGQQAVHTCRLRWAEARFTVALDENINDPYGAFTDITTDEGWWVLNFLKGEFETASRPRNGIIYTPEGVDYLLPSDLCSASFFPADGRRIPYGFRFEGIAAPESLPGLGDKAYLLGFPAATRAMMAEVADDVWHEDRTFVLVRSKAGYYRIDLIKDGKYIDIRRGYSYRILIKNVKSPGYMTDREAVAAPGGNLEYEIVVTPGAEDNIVTSNGQYALSLSNDRTVLVAEPDGEYEIANVRYILPGEMQDLPKKLSNSISFSDNKTGITLLTTSITDTNQAIRIRCEKGCITDDTTVPITIRLGNIVKTLTLVFLCGNIPPRAYTAIHTLDPFCETRRLDTNVNGLYLTRDAEGNLLFMTSEANDIPVGWTDSDGNPSSSDTPGAIPVYEYKTASWITTRFTVDETVTRYIAQQDKP